MEILWSSLDFCCQRTPKPQEEPVGKSPWAQQSPPAPALGSPGRRMGVVTPPEVLVTLHHPKLPCSKTVLPGRNRTVSSCVVLHFLATAEQHTGERKTNTMFYITQQPNAIVSTNLQYEKLLVNSQ